MEKFIELPKDVSVELNGKTLIVKGPKGEVSRFFKSPLITIEVSDKGVTVKSIGDKRRYKRQVNTVVAHVNNLIQGVIEGFEAQLRICYGHFPINTKVEGEKFIIENFVGEKVPRNARIMPETKVEVKGSDVIVTGLNKELVGQTAANIELATRIKNKDSRIFQDGIWLIKKPGKSGL